MEQLAPDWRTIGTPPATTGTAPHAPGRLDGIPMRLIGIVAGSVATAALLGALAALLLLAGTATPASLDDRGGPRSGLAMAVVDGASIAATPTASVTPAAVIVDVEGAVVRPGLVEVPAGGRIGDAIALAGGFAPRVDLTAASLQLNLAEPVQDGIKVHVPAIGDAVSPAGDTASGAASTRGDGRVDLNSASESELDALPGVGPATIAKIVAARSESPFRTADELRTRGIVGEAAWQKLQGLVVVGR